MAYSMGDMARNTARSTFVRRYGYEPTDAELAGGGVRTVGGNAPGVNTGLRDDEEREPRETPPAPPQAPAPPTPPVPPSAPTPPAPPVPPVPPPTPTPTAPPAPPAPTAPPPPPPFVPPPANPSTPSGSLSYARAQVVAAYKQYLGRTPSDAEIAGHLHNNTRFDPATVGSAVYTISMSPEASARRSAPGGGATTPPPAGGTTTPDPNGQYGTTPRTDMGSGAGSAKWNYTGFDFNQDANNRLIGKSAKYTLADATRQAAEDGVEDIWKTKAGAQIFAEKYLQPKLEAAGFEVIDIKGDKIFVRDHADRAAGRPGSWVDWVVNADGENPAIAWQVEKELSAFGPESYTPSTTFKATDTTKANTPDPDPNRGGDGLTPDDEAYRLLARRRPSMGDVGRGKRDEDALP